MATYAARHIEPILAAAKRWAQICLVEDGSIFEQGQLWTADAFALLDRYFVQQPDDGNDTFYQKLAHQMASAPPEAPKLMAEILWFMFLFPSSLKPPKKREGILGVWRMSGHSLDPSHAMLADDVLHGIGSGGAAYNNKRAQECMYAISLFSEIKRLPTAERAALVTNYESLSDWLERMPRDGDRQFRHMLRYLLCPDRVERISSNAERRHMLSGFGVAKTRDMKTWSDRQLDDALYKLRQRFEKQLGTRELDFYSPPLREQWRRPEKVEVDPARNKQLESGYEQLQVRFQKHFPNFGPVSIGLGYQERERNYKVELVEAYARDVAPCLDEEDWGKAGAAAIDLIKNPLKANDGKPQNIVGWRFSAYLLDLKANQHAAFGRMVGDLVDEDQPLDERVDAFVASLAKLVGQSGPVQAAAQRSITGFYLALAHPDRHLFIKTRELQRAFRMLDPSFKWTQKRFSGTDLLRVEELASWVYDRLKQDGWNPQDMIDVQGFFWVAAAYDQSVAEVDPEDDDEEQANETTMSGTDSSPVEPKNEILFGPPGTGKTYELQQRMRRFYMESAEKIDGDAWRNAQIASRIAPLSWWEVLGAALFERRMPVTIPELLRHPYILAAASVKDKNRAIRSTLWASLQIHALKESDSVNLARRNAPYIFEKDDEARWRLEGPWREHLSEIIDIVDEINKGPRADSESVRRFEFVTFHQSFSYEDFIEGLTPSADDETGTIRYDIKKGVFLRLCERARADPSHAYAMFIDEINRGNISKIFGELITLIETDKREGRENALALTLPYSGDSFSVPANLHVIGTMNTADRSLTGLDVAMRRRFDFTPMQTNLNMFKDLSVGPVDITKMLEVMNQRIEALLDRDHLLGHSYFRPLLRDASLSCLASIFRKQIVPLLQEYFFEDWQRIAWVLNDHRKIKDHQFIRAPTWTASSLFGPGAEVTLDGKLWEINDEAFDKIESYAKIISTEQA